MNRSLFGLAFGVDEGATRLAEYERLLRTLLDASLDAVVSIDEEGRFIEFNPAAEQMFGYSRAEVVGQSLVDTIIPEPLRAPHRYGFERFRRTGEAQLLDRRIEISALRRDGVVFPVELTIFRIEIGGRLAFMAYLRDISARKAVLEALERSEARNRRFIEGAGYGMYESTLGGQFVWVNPALVRMLGYDSDRELLALDLAREIYARAEDRERQMAELRSGVQQSHEVEWIRKDRRHIVVRLTGRAIHDAWGDVQSFEMIVEDVTERRSLEQQLLQSQKMETIGLLAGGIAHDFNNLLTAIIGNAALLGETLKEDDPRSADLDQIKAAADRAAALTRQLLAFSRKQIAQRRVMDLTETIRAFTAMLQRILGEHIEINLSLDPNTTPIVADPGQIEQVILNLAVNARDAMPKGGRLTIETSNVVLGDEYVGTHVGATAGAYVLLAVSDTGEGMTADIQARIFEPFFTTKAQSLGTGLGLATVYGIVKQTSGNVWVYSEPGRGSTFKVYLPQSTGTPARPATAEAAASGRETILLVEDDSRLRELISTLLRRRGYRVVSAAHGKEAIAIARTSEEHFDLLLTDVVLPELDGVALAKEIMAITPDTRVLFMSGYTDNAMRHQGVLDASVDFLQKPFTPDTLAAALRAVLDR